MTIEIQPHQQESLEELTALMGFELPSDTLNAAMQALRARHIIRNAQQEVFDLQIAPALSRLDSGLREALDVEQFLNQRHQKYLSSGNDA